MKEINIAKVLVSKRKEKGITQDELANFIGVSKASVSKWETGQSYPDVTFLPWIAAYFNISIDDLMDYKPQMAKEDIRKFYHKMSGAFASQPFDEVMNQCREIINKYFACFPLLLNMGLLILNHNTFSRDAGKMAASLTEAKELFIRVKQESKDAELVKQALYLEACCWMALGDPRKVPDLLEQTNALLLPIEQLLASAHQMTGQIEDAKITLQIGIYRHIVSLLGLFPAYLMLCENEPERFEEVLLRALTLAEAFDLKQLHPVILINLYLAAAHGYIMQGNKGKTLDMLQHYAQIAAGNVYPLKLHGDAFFNLIDGWLAELDLGVTPQHDEKTIKQSMYDSVVNNPDFSSIAEDYRFKSLAEKLKTNCQDTAI